MRETEAGCPEGHSDTSSALLWATVHPSAYLDRKPERGEPRCKTNLSPFQRKQGALEPVVAVSGGPAGVQRDKSPVSRQGPFHQVPTAKSPLLPHSSVISNARLEEGSSKLLLQVCIYLCWLIRKMGALKLL